VGRHTFIEGLKIAGVIAGVALLIYGLYVVFN